ncbi:MAG: hypothetical protein ACJA1L_001377 [Paracoccaceae bacterium]|jgi:hypothetical protein
MAPGATPHLERAVRDGRRRIANLIRASMRIEA